MKKEEIEKMDTNNIDYEYTDVVDIPNVEELHIFLYFTLLKFIVELNYSNLLKKNE